MTELEHDGETIPHVEKKDPDSQVSHGFDYTEWLRAGETIISSSWEIPSGLSLGIDGQGADVDADFTTTHTSILLRGGTLNERYLVTNTITTNQLQTEQRSFYVLVGDK